jgi:hypothetical protein
MESRKLEIFVSVGICSVALVLVIWIQGGFDPVPPHSDSPQQVWDPSDTRLRTGLYSDYSRKITPEWVLAMTMMEKASFPLPGIVHPPVEAASAATAQDSAEVIGVSVNGHSRAYCVAEMVTPFTHVINDVIDGVPVTVTYCDRTGCARVFTNTDEPDRPLEVGVGGFADGQMLLHVDHKKFGQKSRDIPLQELEFEKTTWGKWKSAYPDTDICTGLFAFIGGQKRTVAPVDRDSGGDLGHAGE